MRFSDRGAWLSSAGALLFASWCTGWLWGLLQITHELPGILTSKPGAGAFELLEIPTGKPYPQVLLAVFLLCLLPVFLLSALRGAWDRKGRALASLAWPLRTRSLGLSCLAWVIAGTLLGLLLPGGSVVDPVMLLIWVLALVGTPFLGLNPMTLDAVTPSHWWRPGWPGGSALLKCLLLWVGYLTARFVLGVIVDVSRISWLLAGLSFLDEALLLCVVVLSISIWLSRGRWPQVRGDVARMWGNGFVWEFLWQNLVIGVMILALAVPLLLNALAGIFLLPQYEQWANHVGAQVPLGMRLQGEAYRATDAFLPVLLAPLGLYSLLVQGRLMRQHGVGKARANV